MTVNFKSDYKLTERPRSAQPQAFYHSTTAVDLPSIKRPCLFDIADRKGEVERSNCRCR